MSVHSHKPASPSRVSASCSTPFHMLLFLVQVCKHRLASVLPSLTVLAGSVASWSIGVVGNCLIGQLIGLAFAARTRAFLPSTCGPRHAKTHLDPVKAGPTSVTLLWGSQSGCVRAWFFVVLNEGFEREREILVSTEQLRSLLECLRLIRQLLRT